MVGGKERLGTVALVGAECGFWKRWQIDKRPRGSRRGGGGRCVARGGKADFASRRTSERTSRTWKEERTKYNGFMQTTAELYAPSLGSERLER